MMQRGMRMKRVSVAGVWRERGEEPILYPDASDVIAMKRTYTFERSRGQRTANPPRATWTMYEYRLVRTDVLNQHLSMVADANVHTFFSFFLYMFYILIEEPEFSARARVYAYSLICSLFHSKVIKKKKSTLTCTSIVSYICNIGCCIAIYTLLCV